MHILDTDTLSHLHAGNQNVIRAIVRTKHSRSQDGMEFSMTQQLRIPDSATSKRLLDNLRRSRLELAESNFELAEISALLENDLSQQQLKRVKGFATQ
jgi:hypothetical protein